MHIGQSVAAALEAKSQFCVVDAQAVEQCGVQVVDVDGILGDVVAVVVRAAVSLPTFDAASGQPQTEAAWMVISSVVVLREVSLAIHRSPKFSAPDNQRVFEKSSLFKVQNESRRGLVGIFTLFADSRRELGVLIPAAVKELRESNASLGHSSSQQAVVRKRARHFCIFTVQFEDVVGF